MGRQTPFNPAAHAAERLKRLDKQAQVLAAERADAANPERWGVAANALALPANRSVEAGRDGRGRVAHAHRTDVFERLHERGSLSDGQLAAVRRLEQDIGLRAGLFRPPAALVKVDAQARVEGATQRMLEAGRRVDSALAASGPRCALLLRALVEPGVLKGAAVDWREVTARETAETNPHAQAARVRTACDNLMLAYQAIDHTRRASPR